MYVFSNRAFLAGLQNPLRILFQGGYKDTSTRVKMHVAVQQMQVKFHTGQKIEKMSGWFMLLRTARTLMMGESPPSRQAVTQKVHRAWIFGDKQTFMLNLKYLYITWLWYSLTEWCINPVWVYGISFQLSIFYLGVLKNYYFVFMCTWASMPLCVCRCV